MTESNNNWQSKIRFFTKFIGYDMGDLQDTLDQTNKSQFTRRLTKGIQIVNTSTSIQSMILPNYQSQEVDRKWMNFIRMCYPESSKSQLLKLTYQGVCNANKVMPWLAQNKQKINLKLFNIKKLQYRNTMNPNSPYLLEKMNQQLQILSIKLGPSNLTELLGIMLLYREDIQFNDTFLAIGQTVNEYLFDAPIIAFQLLYNFCCLGALLPFLVNDQENINFIINEVCVRVRTNCTSSAFLIRDQIPFHQFIKVMIQCFWLNISENRTEFREKILYFLLINKISIGSVSKVCEAAINGLSRILNQGNKQKSIQVLNNPRAFLDEEVFLNYLFLE